MQTDPSLTHGFKLMYERKLPVELHIKDPELLSKLKKDISNNEIMNIKICSRR